MKGRRKDWFLVSDAAASLLRMALEDADAQGALAVLAEIHTGFDFRPVLAAGTGRVTRREIAMVRDGQGWRTERDPKALAEIDVDAAPEAPEAPEAGPRPHAPTLPPQAAPEALAKAAQRAAGTPPPVPPQALSGLTVARALTRRDLPQEARAVLRDWFLANQKDADHVEAIAVLEGRA